MNDSRSHFSAEHLGIIDEIHKMAMDTYKRQLASRRTANEMLLLEKSYPDIALMDKKIMLENISKFIHSATNLLQPNCLEGIGVSNEQVAQIGKQQIADAIISFFHLIRSTFILPEFLVPEETALINTLSAARLKRFFSSLNKGESYK